MSTACQPAQIVDFQLGLQPAVVKATQMVGACYSRQGNQSGHFLFSGGLAEHSSPLLIFPSYLEAFHCPLHTPKQTEADRLEWLLLGPCLSNVGCRKPPSRVLGYWFHLAMRRSHASCEEHLCLGFLCHSSWRTTNFLAVRCGSLKRDSLPEDQVRGFSSSPVPVTRP